MILKPIPACVLSALVLAACSPPASHDRPTIKPEYTTPEVVAAFDQRYALSEKESGSPKVRVEGLERTYSSIAEAVEAAPPGTQILVGPGIYRESVTLVGKELSIVGAGADKSILVSRKTPLTLLRSEGTVSSLGLIALSVGSDVSPLVVSESRATVADCRMSGGTGPGISLAGSSSDVTLVGNIVTGNMGGGIRVAAGRTRLLRNTVTLNAVAGIVLAPTAPGAIHGLSLWHDTVLDNWGGHRCMSFAKTAAGALPSLERFEVEASILNSGGLAETFSEEFFASLKNGGRNYLSAESLPAPDFFTDPAAGDFRPRGKLVPDSLGIEIGAFPSKQGMEKLRATLSNALVTEKLQLGYMLSFFLPYEERIKAHDQIRQLLYRWLDEYLRTGALGTRLVGALGLMDIAPPDWKVGIIVQKFAEGLASRYLFGLRPLNFFVKDPELAGRVKRVLGDELTYFPRFITPDESAPNAFVLGGAVLARPRTTTTETPIRIARTVANPFHEEIVKTVKILESRKAENDRKIQDTQDALNNPHFTEGKESKHRQNLEKKLARLKEDGAAIDTDLTARKAQLGKSKPVYDVVIEGKSVTAVTRGEFSLQFVAAPAGDILLDTTQEEISFRSTRVVLAPNPEFDYPGITLGEQENDVEERLAREISALLLRSTIAKETQDLKLLLDRFHGGVISTTEEATLVEQLVMNAPLYRDALAARREYEALLALTESTGEDLEVYVVKDTGGRTGIRIEVTWRAKAKDEARRRFLEDVYRPYWELQKPIDDFLRIRFGLTRTLFFEARARLDAFVKK